ncbi:hypothetical protein QE436_003703 [Pantoea anthophila]|nr:hypothetical protein [Pantoea anthophila]
MKKCNFKFILRIQSLNPLFFELITPCMRKILAITALKVEL